MRIFALLIAALLAASPALAADKRVLRIDSLTATQKDGAILVQAKGAVPSGGWTRPHLHLVHGDAHSVVLEFLATPPPSGMTVIDGLVPVTFNSNTATVPFDLKVIRNKTDMLLEDLK